MGFFTGIFLPIFPHLFPMTHFAIFNLWNIVKLPLGSFRIFPPSGLSVQQSLPSAVLLFLYSFHYNIFFILLYLAPSVLV